RGEVQGGARDGGESRRGLETRLGAGGSRCRPGGWRVYAGEVGGGEAPSGRLPGDGVERGLARVIADVQVLALQVAVHQRRGQAGAGAREGGPCALETVEVGRKPTKRRGVVRRERRVGEIRANGLETSPEVVEVPRRPAVWKASRRQHTRSRRMHQRHPAAGERELRAIGRRVPLVP